MPVSQGSAGGLPGLNLKAWAQVSSAGVLLRGFNVSAASRTAAGNYSLTLENAVGEAVCVCNVLRSSSLVGLVAVGSASGVTAQVVTGANGTGADAPFYVQVYD